MHGSTALSEVVFLDVEADRAGRILAVAALRGDDVLTLDLAGRGMRDGSDAAAELARFAGRRTVGGHNVVAFDLPLLAQPPFSFRPAGPVVDTLVLSMLAEPARQSHALEKPADRPAGALPDPAYDARRCRERAEAGIEELTGIEAGPAAFYASLLRRAGHAGIADLFPASELGSQEPHEAARALPATLLERFCRVRLAALLDTLDGPADHLALALALRFIEAEARDGRLPRPPAAALAALPRFTELLTRLMGPLCPDRSCVHRARCDVHRPFAEDVLRDTFELDSFRPHQREIIDAVLEGKGPLAVLPTGGGKSLCYQLPAVHGARRLSALTVVISPLVALMADQVRSLSARFPPVCQVSSSLLMEERRRNLAGLRSGAYHVLYMSPEQLRNPSIARLLEQRPPFLWVIDEAHCISQWGHSFRTDYTYLPRGIARVHRGGHPPLVALFTATATTEVEQDIARQMHDGLGVPVLPMRFGTRRENLAFEVVHTADAQAKRVELASLLEAFPEGSRLVYCATVRTACDVAAALREQGVPCALYHGRLAANEKAEQLERFLGGEARTVVATSAFGMGIDKPDIRLVVHYEAPGSLEDYVQESGRAGRDGEPARCVLLYCESDLETQFYLKSATRVTARDVRYVFRALRRRAARLRRLAGEDGRVDLWVNAEDLFIEEGLEEELEWSRDVITTKLRLVLYHLEADGVLERLENRTRAFGIFPLCASIEEAVQKLPERASPATRRVLDYLYGAERPRRVSILDVADEAGLRPAEAFREVQALAAAGLIGQELSFEVTFARGVPRPTRDLAARAFDALEALLELGDDLDAAPLLALRPAAAEVGQRIGAPLPPHELLSMLRALRQQGLLRLDKQGRGRYRVDFRPTFIDARARLRRIRRTAEAVLVWVDGHLSGKSGRDLGFAFDVRRFLDEERRLTESFTHEDVVDACLLLHHLEAWHLADPPVLLESAMRVRIDPRARVRDLDLVRPRRHHAHDIALVHLIRRYAELPPDRRAAYVDDYFTRTRREHRDAWFEKGERKMLTRPVSPRTEARILEGLTLAQREAVTSEDRALLVVAGPGSGKTHTVVRRIEHMIRARQVRPDEILVLAFNRSAAAELAGRLEVALGPRGRRVDVRTFHSLALRLTGDDLSEDRTDPEARLETAMARAAELLSCADDPEGAEEVRRRVLGSVRHVLVDEYQDLDPDQYRLLAGLVGLEREKGRERTERSVYVVGDDDQAIYGFRNASVEFLRRFEEEFGARRVCLADNFRSNARIVEAAARYASRLPGRLKQLADEQMRPAGGAAEGGERAVRRFRYGDHGALSAHVAYVVQRSLDAGMGTIAVLARHWSALDDVRCLLEDGGVDFAVRHRELHRPLHRRHPVERILRDLWSSRRVVEGPAEQHSRALAEQRGRTATERSVAELLALAAEIDIERALGSTGRLAPMTEHELADQLVLNARDAALRDAGGRSARVSLCTFHGAKGLEFDKVVVLPSRASDGSDPAEERRAFYVAMTRAREELVLATLDEEGEAACAVEAPAEDLRGVARRLPRAEAGYLDCDPSCVRLSGSELAPAQRNIAALREGYPLAVTLGSGRVELRHEGALVGLLSTAGRAQLERLRRRRPGALEARVHEIYVHLVRDREGRVRRRILAVLPTIRAGKGRLSSAREP